MKAAKWIGLGLVFFLVALVWQLPAAVVLGHAKLPKEVGIEGVSGTVWQGRVESLSLAGTAFKDVTWQLHPLALFTGKVAASIKSRPDRTRLSGDLAVGFGGKLAIENLIVRVPVAPLVAGVHLPVPSQVGGELSVAIAQYRQGQPWCEALKGKAQWLDASVTNKFGDFNLGRIDADLDCDKGAVTAVIRDTPPRLGLELEARLDGQRYHIRGFAKPAADQPKNLRDAFAFFGRPAADGRYPVQFQGTLPR
ncbi:type II secretion system protein N [Gallaecimonas pentaromativorans]|uniref:type II secretion system protein N n=1 Tax=Gallaecimonas pentaromativorans TaxID=584787 RepID=UPI003A8F573E